MSGVQYFERGKRIESQRSPALVFAEVAGGGKKIGSATASHSLFYLRRMEKRDLPSVMAIEKLSFPRPWPEASFRGEIDNFQISFPQVMIRRADERVIGYILLWYFSEEAQISNFAVHPDFRRMGIGGAALVQVLEWLQKFGAKHVSLEVRPSNAIARALYLKFGFKVLGRKKEYYQHPVEDALIMGKELG